MNEDEENNKDEISEVDKYYEADELMFEGQTANVVCDKYNITQKNLPQKRKLCEMFEYLWCSENQIFFNVLGMKMYKQDNLTTEKWHNISRKMYLPVLGWVPCEQTCSLVVAGNADDMGGAFQEEVLAAADA